jgi:hypothetical protein
MNIARFDYFVKYNTRGHFFSMSAFCEAGNNPNQTTQGCLAATKVTLRPQADEIGTSLLSKVLASKACSSVHGQLVAHSGRLFKPVFRMLTICFSRRLISRHILSLMSPTSALPQLLRILAGFFAAHPSIRSLMRLTMLGVMPCRVLKSSCFRRRSRPRFFHRIGDPVGIQDGARLLMLCAQSPGSASTAGNLSCRHPESLHSMTPPSSPFAQQVDTYQHIESAQPQVTQKSDPLNGLLSLCR